MAFGEHKIDALEHFVGHFSMIFKRMIQQMLFIFKRGRKKEKYIKDILTFLSRI